MDFRNCHFVGKLGSSMWLSNLPFAYFHVFLNYLCVGGVHIIHTVPQTVAVAGCHV